MADYIYKSLSPQRGSIRLLRLLPRKNTESSDIECELFESQYTNQQYNALSYCWGAADKPCHLTIDGARIAITVSLHAALTQLLSNETHTLLWVDAVCINQEDAFEKSQQVASMRHVYQHAECVLTWLGPAGEDSDIAIKWIWDVAAKANEIGLTAKSARSTQKVFDYLEDYRSRDSPSADHSQTQASSPIHLQVSTVNGMVQDIPSFLGGLYHTLSTSHENHYTLIAALQRLLHRDYWRRAWVVQEIYSARTIQFICGSLTIDEDSLHTSLGILLGLFEYMLRHDHLNMFPEFDTFNANTILKIRTSGRSGDAMPLVYLLRQFRRSESSLREDKVYSLLGMAADADELGLAPDYTMGTRDGLVGVARALLRAGYTEILSLCNDIDRLPDLPSWVPDWGVLGAQAFLCQRIRTGPRVTVLQPTFDASADLLPIVYPECSDQRPDALSLTAIPVGAINKVGKPFSFGFSHEWLEDLLAFCPKGSGLPSQRLQIACRTAVADQNIRKGNQKPRLDPKILQQVCDCVGAAWPRDLLGHLRQEGFVDYSQQVWKVGRGRVPVQIGGKYVGIAPDHVEVGDRVCIVAGATVPYIFRRIVDTEDFMLVGEVYVGGVMDGEVVRMEGAQSEVITVV